MAGASRQGGFSALELSVVVLVFGIIAATGIPYAVSAYRSYELTNAANALAQQLNRCRQEAVRLNVQMKIRVSPHFSRIDLNRSDSFDADDGPVVGHGEDAGITDMSPSDGIVTFTSRGELPIGVTPSFTMTYSGYARVVSVDPRGAVEVGPETPAQ